MDAMRAWCGTCKHGVLDCNNQIVPGAAAEVSWPCELFTKQQLVSCALHFEKCCIAYIRMSTKRVKNEDSSYLTLMTRLLT